MRGRYVKYTVWRPISNTHENMANNVNQVVKVHEDGYKDLMGEGGTSGVLWGEFLVVEVV